MINKFVNSIPKIIYCEDKAYTPNIEKCTQYTIIEYKDSKNNILCHSIDTDLFLASYGIRKFISNNKDKIVCVYCDIETNKDVYIDKRKKI